MNYGIKKRKASASVIVLFMTVIIITLGLSFVFINKTNYKLSDKNKTWLLDYYTIEAIMDEDISLVEDYVHDNLEKIVKNETVNFKKLSSPSMGKRDYILSKINLDKEDDKLSFNLFLDNKMLEEHKIESNIGLELCLIYEINNDIFYIESKKEVPPNLEYDSFY